jgi:DNA-binding XRE family transcriptional regulator
MCAGNQPNNNAPVPEPNREHGRYIYVIGPKTGPFKIGIANDVQKRRGELNVGNPAHLKVHIQHDAGSEEAGRRLELRLHFTFRAKQVRGEWFNLTTQDLDGLGGTILSYDFFDDLPDGWTLERKVLDEFTPDVCSIARDGLGLTQQSLADAAELSVQTIRNFENRTTIPHQETIETIRAALEAQGALFQRQDDGSLNVVLPGRRPN